MTEFNFEPFEIAKNWLPKLFSELLRIRQDRALELTALSETFGDPFQLSKYYVEPNCQNINPVDFGEDYAVVKQPVFQLIEGFIGEERKNNQMFLLSDAGMGKTSLLMMLKLAHITSFWPNGYNCVLLKLGEETLGIIRGISEKHKTVLLLDALDEDPLAWERARERTVDLLKATSFFKRVIITCRTQFFTANGDPFNRRGQVEIGGILCTAIYCSLFSDNQVQLYLRKRFPEKFKNIEWRTRVQEILSGMGFLRMRPMLLAHIDDILESGDGVWNEYSILRALIDAWLLREQRKARNAPPDFKKKLKIVCRKVAVDMFSSRRRYITKNTEELLRIEFESGVGYNGFSIGSRSLLNKDSDGNYRFSHSIIQEVLAVEYLIGNPTFALTSHGVITNDMNRIAAAWVRQASSPVLSTRDLSIFDFSDQDFSGIKFGKITLANANLAGAKLIGCLLFAADMRNADLRGADLSESDLSGANLHGALLSGAVLKKSICIATDFEAASLDGCNLNGADFSQATLINCDLSYASMAGTIICGAIIEASDFDPANFEGAIGVDGVKLVNNSLNTLPSLD